MNGVSSADGSDWDMSVSGDAGGERHPSQRGRLQREQPRGLREVRAQAFEHGLHLAGDVLRDLDRRHRGSAARLEAGVDGAEGDVPLEHDLEGEAHHRAGGVDADASQRVLE